MLHYQDIGTLGFEGQSNRTMHIRKTRATCHFEDTHPIEINSKGKDTGINVKTRKRTFSDK